MNAQGEPRAERRLAAILAADVAGYSRLMEADEEGTLAALRSIRRELADPAVAQHNGRIVKTTGDGLLVEFSSVVDAMRCAIAVQRAMAERNAGVATERRIEFRIGINLGDVIVEDGDIFGDGVNIAARLETLAEPGGICVSGVVREQVGGRVEVEFDDLGEQQVKNITRPVHVWRVRLQPAAPAAEAALPLPDKPSLVVLPFQNMSGDPEQEYFADGMVEEITTAISRLPWLFVIARNSAFTYKGKAVDMKQVSRDLGVRYVLEGSVRKAGNRVRITGQLIDTATGAHIWADRFDGSLDDVFELQDQVASSVAGAIEPRLRQSEIERASRKPTESLSAYDLYLRAVVEDRSSEPERFRTALSFARRALAIDPLYAPAAGLIGDVRAHQIVAGVVLGDDEVADALRHARLAIQNGSNDPEALCRGANTIALIGGQHAEAMNAIDRAISLNPNSARAWHSAAAVHCFANRPNEAIDAIHRAMRLSPLDPAGFGFKWILGYALMQAGRYTEALDWVDRSLHDRPNFHAPLRGKIALLGYLGRVEEARHWIDQLLVLNPVHTIAWFKNFGGKFLSPGTLSVWVEGLRLAGLPEE